MTGSASGVDGGVLSDAGVGVVLAEGLAVGDKLGPAGTAACGLMLALIGSYGRLVK